MLPVCPFDIFKSDEAMWERSEYWFGFWGVTVFSISLHTIIPVRAVLCSAFGLSTLCLHFSGFNTQCFLLFISFSSLSPATVPRVRDTVSETV